MGHACAKITAPAAPRGIICRTITPAAGLTAGAKMAWPAFCDDHGQLCLAVALWNEHDPILKERLFGLTNSEGNHGEDVKECYWYLDALPTHSYLKMLYKYPQREFPYNQLVEENRRRTKHDPEFELIDTGVFDDDRYFDVFVEYAKAGPRDVLMQITVTNRGPEAARLHVLPQLWFRNIWSWRPEFNKPKLSAGRIRTRSRPSIISLGRYHWYIDGDARTAVLATTTRTYAGCSAWPMRAGLFQRRLPRIPDPRQSRGGKSRAQRHQGGGAFRAVDCRRRIGDDSHAAQRAAAKPGVYRFRRSD